jgi:hypothetical protein
MYKKSTESLCPFTNGRKVFILLKRQVTENSQKTTKGDYENDNFYVSDAYNEIWTSIIYLISLLKSYLVLNILVYRGENGDSEKQGDLPTVQTAKEHSH